MIQGTKVVRLPVSASHENLLFDPWPLGELQEALAEDGATLRSFLKSYLEGTDLSVQAMSEALDAGRPDTLERLAHTVKGQAATVGARRLAYRCAELERCARARVLENADSLINQIRNDFEIVRPLLAERIATAG